MFRFSSGFISRMKLIGHLESDIRMALILWDGISAGQISQGNAINKKRVPSINDQHSRFAQRVNCIESHDP